MTLIAAIVAALSVWAGTAAAQSPRGRVDAFLEHHWPRGASGTVLVASGGRTAACKGLGWADRARRAAAYTVLSRQAKRELFAPRMRIDTGVSAAYGWDIFASPLGPIAAHNGGNGWSFGVIARVLQRKTMVFWISNHA
jgi:hypothetical protein